MNKVSSANKKTVDGQTYCQVVKERVFSALQEKGLSVSEIKKVWKVNTPSEIMEMIDDCECEVRVCDVCGKFMVEGFCIDDGWGYYCSEKCMHEDGMTTEEYLELYADGEGSSYFTDWL